MSELHSDFAKHAADEDAHDPDYWAFRCGVAEGQLGELLRCARGTVRTAHPAVIRDAVVPDWWAALRAIIQRLSDEPL